MKTRNEVGQAHTAANLSKRSRQSSLLFNGTQTESTLPMLSEFLEPKLPPLEASKRKTLMNTRSDVSQKNNSVANPSKWSRLDSLLFQGTKLGTTLALAAFLEPKIPPFKGE